MNVRPAGRQMLSGNGMADDYLCTLGDVYKAALPSGMKLESETVVVYNPDFEAVEPLTEREQSVMNLLSAETEQCITQLEKSSGIRQILPVIKSLLGERSCQSKGGTESAVTNHAPKHASGLLRVCRMKKSPRTV